MKKDKIIGSDGPTLIFSKLFLLLVSSGRPGGPMKNSLPSMISVPPITVAEREVFKIFLWHDFYIYLLSTLEIKFKEDDMFKPQLIRALLAKLLQEEEYSLEGIANTTRIPLEVLEDIIYETNTNPSFSVSSKLIEFYVIVKREEYTEFLRKIFQWVQYHYFKKE